jgi:hypothetical protein
MSCANAAIVQLPHVRYWGLAQNPFREQVLRGEAYLNRFPADDDDEPVFPLTLAGAEVQEWNSVDEDDGILDNGDNGSGALAPDGSWYMIPPGILIMSFRFDEAGRGRLPDYFGFVFTNPGEAYPYMDILGQGNTLLERIDMRSIVETYNNGGGTGVNDDWFAGFRSTQGIQEVVLYGFGTIDHLTWGWTPVPEPGSAVLVAAGAGWMLRRRKR